MRRARFSLRSLLLAMVLLVLALPLAGLLFLRMYESALIRQTESELVSQAAVVAAAFKAQRLAHGTTDATRAEIVPGPLEIARRPGLDLAYDRVLPPPADPVPSSPASAGAAEAGAALQPVLREAQGVTLAAMRVLDPAGVIVATTGNDLGQSLAAQDEVRRALRGEPVSVMRRREKLARWMPEGISRGSALRVYVALPVLDDDRVLGAVLVVRTPADISQALWGKRWELAALGIVLLGVGAGLALAVSRLITRPLALVTAQATRVAAGSTGAVEALARPGTREVAALSAAIVAMADTLDRRATYVRTLAAHIAHEFKTPLAATRGAAELLGDHAMSQAERDRFVGVIEAEVARLDRLTRRLLDLARADMADGRVGGPTNLRPTLEAAAARYAERGLQVTLGAGEARVAMRGEALELMLDGLLDNALAHGGQTVEIAVRREADCVVIRVADDGPGISTANAARVFEPFFTTARERGGTGLGLPIVQALAAGVGGGVRLATARSGAAFEIELPAAESDCRHRFAGLRAVGGLAALLLVSVYSGPYGFNVLFRHGGTWWLPVGVDSALLFLPCDWPNGPPRPACYPLISNGRDRGPGPNDGQAGAFVSSPTFIGVRRGRWHFKARPMRKRSASRVKPERRAGGDDRSRRRRFALQREPDRGDVEVERKCTADGVGGRERRAGNVPAFAGSGVARVSANRR